MNKKNQKEVSIADIYFPKSKRNVVSMNSTGQAALSYYINNHRSAIDEKFRVEAIKYYKAIIENQQPDEEISDEIAENALQYLIKDFKPLIPFPEPLNPKFTFIDLFAGIGGFRLAMQKLAGKCVFTSES